MFYLWWFDPSWKETRCANCGRRIWPEGDPDWGLCFDCFTEEIEERRREEEYEQWCMEKQQRAHEDLEEKLRNEKPRE